MPQPKSPRNLGEVSHLFLSTRASESRLGRQRAEAVLWLGAIGRSGNRAHLAAGVASALTRQGIFVTLMEVSRGLPTVGYYFGMDPSDYAAPCLERTRFVSGVWNGMIRYCFGAHPHSFSRWRPDAVPPQLPHALLAAFQFLEEDRDEVFFPELRDGVAPFAEHGRLDTGSLEAFVVAGGRSGGSAAESGVRRARKLCPGIPIFSLRQAGEPPFDGADETLEIPGNIAVSWAKRTPPVEPFFTDLASHLLQVLSHRSRRVARDAAGG